MCVMSFESSEHAACFLAINGRRRSSPIPRDPAICDLFYSQQKLGGFLATERIGTRIEVLSERQINELVTLD